MACIQIRSGNGGHSGRCPARFQEATLGIGAGVQDAKTPLHRTLRVIEAIPALLTEICGVVNLLMVLEHVEASLARLESERRVPLLVTSAKPVFNCALYFFD